MLAVSRLSFVHATSVTDYKVKIGGMFVGGIIGLDGCLVEALRCKAPGDIRTGGKWDTSSILRELPVRLAL